MSCSFIRYQFTSEVTKKSAKKYNPFKYLKSIKESNIIDFFFTVHYSSLIILQDASSAFSNIGNEIKIYNDHFTKVKEKSSHFIYHSSTPFYDRANLN